MSDHLPIKELNDVSQFVRRVTKLRSKISQVVSVRAIRSGFDLFSNSRKEFLSNQAISHLLQQAYYASLESDEGRKTQLRLYWQPCWGRMYDLVTFPEPLFIDAKVLAKIAQGTNFAFAFNILENSGMPYTSGIISYGSFHDNLHSMMSKDYPGMTITIREPGYIEFQEDPISFVYKRGMIIKRSSIQQNTLVMKWLNEVTQNLSQNMAASQERKDYSAQRYSVEPIISTLLRNVVDQGHGGMIVILPEKGRELLKIGYPLNSDDMRMAIMKHWAELYETRCVTEEGRQIPNDKKEFLHLLNADETSHRWLSNSLKGLSQLANMDGCVVFGQQLTLLGFGAIIQAQEQALASQRRLRTKSGWIDENAALGLRGTRHRSAFQLCKAVPNAIAFVISQDGDLRIFASDEESVFFQDDAYV